MTEDVDRKRTLSSEASEEPSDQEHAEDEVIGPVKDDEPPAKKQKGQELTRRQRS